MIKSARFKKAIEYAETKKFSGKYRLMKELKIGEALYFLGRNYEAKSKLTKGFDDLNNVSYFNQDQKKYIGNYCKYFLLKIDGNNEFIFNDNINIKKIGGAIHSIFWHQTNYQ